MRQIFAACMLALTACMSQEEKGARALATLFVMQANEFGCLPAPGSTTPGCKSAISGKIDFVRIDDSTLVATCMAEAGDPACAPWWYSTTYGFSVNAIDTEAYSASTGYPVGKMARIRHWLGGEDKICVQWSLDHSEPKACHDVK